MRDNAAGPGGPVLSEELGAVAELRREFEEWAYVRDYDVTHSLRNPQQYANERTQGAWQAWGHGTANWRDMRDRAVELLRRCEQALADNTGPHWPARAALRADVRKALGLGA